MVGTLFVIVLHISTSKTSDNTQNQQIIISSNNTIAEILNNSIATKAHIRFPIPNLTHVNYSKVYYIPQEANVKKELDCEGVVNNAAQKYVFLCTTSHIKDIDKNLTVYNLGNLGLTDHGGFYSNTGSSHPTAYEHQKTFAFYAAQFDTKSKNSASVFGLVEPNNGCQYVRLILSKLFSNTQPDKYFFSPSYVENKGDQNVELTYVILKDTLNINSNTERLHKAQLFIPKTRTTAQYCLYAFLRYSYKNNNQNIPHKLIIAHHQYKKQFRSIYSVNNVFVENELKKIFSQNQTTSDTLKEGSFLNTLFYAFYMHKANTDTNKDAILYGEDDIKESTVSLTIAILDTECFENQTQKNITAHILVKIYLSAKIQNVKNPEPIDPIYAIFQTTLPFFYSPDDYKGGKVSIPDLNWKTRFFHYGGGIDQNFYFTPNDQAMPGNDVRHLKIIDENSNKKIEDQYIPSIIKSITEEGILYENPLNLPSIEYKEEQRLLNWKQDEQENAANRQIISSPGIRNVEFTTTELLQNILEGMKYSNVNENTRNQTIKNPADNIFLFAQGLLTEIETLKKYILSLEDTIFNLSKRHNEFFQLKKDLDTQEKIIQKMVGQIEKATAELDKKQKKLVETGLAEIQKNIENNVQSSINKVNDLLNKEIATQTEQNNTFLNKLKDDLIKTSNTHFETQKTDIIKLNEEIKTKGENVTKELENFKILLKKNQENLEKLQNFTIDQKELLDKLISLEEKIEELKKACEVTMKNSFQGHQDKMNDYEQKIIDYRKEINTLKNTTFYLKAGLGVTSVGLALFAFYFWWHVMHTNAKLQFLLQNKVA
jgi:hypothetical protein